MRAKSLLNILYFSLLCCCLTSPAGADPQLRLVNDIFEQANLNSMFEQTPELIEVTFAQMPQQHDPKLDKLKVILKQAFEPDTLRQAAQSHISKQFNDNELEEIRSYLATPLALHMAELEKASNDPAAIGQILAYSFELESKPPSDQRMELIAQLINASNTVEVTLAVRDAFFSGFLAAANQLDPPEKRMTAQQMAEQMTAIRKNMQQETAQGVIITFLYLYQDVTDKQLQDYINLHLEPVMSAFTREISQAVASSFSGASQQIMTEVAGQY